MVFMASRIHKILSSYLDRIQPGYSELLGEMTRIRYGHYGSGDSRSNGSGLCGEMTTIMGGVMIARFGVPAFFTGVDYGKNGISRPHVVLRVLKPTEGYTIDMTNAQTGSEHDILFIPTVDEVEHGLVADMDPIPLSLDDVESEIRAFRESYRPKSWGAKLAKQAKRIHRYLLDD